MFHSVGRIMGWAKNYRMGMTLETAKTRMNTGFFARPYCS